MKKVIILGMVLTAGGALAPQASAQRYAIKAYDNIGLGNSMSVDNAQPGQTAKSNFNAFGLDFGYTFWRKGTQSLEANIGLGYSSSNTNFRIDDMKYHYNAPSIADVDGNTYIRYYDIRNLQQKAFLGYLNIPIYLEYQYKPLKWLGIHAEVGFGLGFRVVGHTGSVSGVARAWGVFPEYDDLYIDDPYYDDFGDRVLNGSPKEKANMKGFNASVMCGAGFEFYAYEPVSFEVGVRYNAGLGQCFGGRYAITGTGEYTAETAPVTYTVKDGTVVKPLADYTTKSRLSPLTLHLGVNVRF